MCKAFFKRILEHILQGVQHICWTSENTFTKHLRMIFKYKFVLNTNIVKNNKNLDYVIIKNITFRLNEMSLQQMYISAVLCSLYIQEATIFIITLGKMELQFKT